MKALFVRESGAGLLLTALLMLSALSLLLETTTRLLDPVRGAVGTLVSPLRFIAETPYFISGEVDEVLTSREALQQQNAVLQQQVMERVPDLPAVSRPQTGK